MTGQSTEGAADCSFGWPAEPVVDPRAPTGMSGSLLGRDIRGDVTHDDPSLSSPTASRSSWAGGRGLLVLPRRRWRGPKTPAIEHGSAIRFRRCTHAKAGQFVRTNPELSAGSDVC